MQMVEPDVVTTNAAQDVRLADHQVLTRRCDDLVARETDDGLAIYDQSQQIVHFLNVTAALIWSLCDGHHSVAMICDEMLQSYPDAASRIQDDVDSTIHVFVTAGLLSVHQR